MKPPFVIYQDRKVPIEIPPKWKLLTFPSLPETQAEKDVATLTREALDHPVGCPPLRETVRPKDTVAVLVEDLTRASPKGLILKTLLQDLEEGGVPRDHITIILALGTHRPFRRNELEVAFGRDMVSKYPFVNHDSRSADLVPVGRLHSGTPVKIHPKAHEATFRIGIGSIFPHPMNGFGGGGKILFPGIANFEAILDHHFRNTFREGAVLGKVKGNPFYEEVTAISRKAGLNFIINTVLDPNDQAGAVISGEPVAAHLQGIELSRRMLSQQFLEKSDVTVITSHPYKEGPQIVKPLSPASMVTKEGGCIILAADCTGELPQNFVESFEKFQACYGDHLMGALLDYFEKRRLLMEEGAIDFNMALAMTLAIQHRFRMIMVSGDLPREKVERMGFIFAEDFPRAFSVAEDLCPNPRIHVIPSGGVILPIISGQ